MKIIHFHRNPQTGFHSIENMYAEIRKILRAQGVQIRKVQLPFTCKSHLGKLLNTIYTFFFRADVYHMTGDAHYIAMVLPRNKTLISAHSVEGGRKELVGWKGRLYKWLYFIIPDRHAKYWTTVSNFTRQELLDYIHCKPEKVKIIANPLLPVFLKSPKKFCTTQPIFLQVGTNPRKNIPNLLHAIQSLPCRLHLVGLPSEEEKRLLDKYQIDYKITPKASPKEMNTLYKECDAMVMVSLNESFGMPIIEAQQVGRVVLTSEVTAMPEIGADAAVYVNPYQVDSIRAGIERIISDHSLRLRLIEKGYKNVQRFDMEWIAQQYLDLYKEIADAQKNH
ncbi:MAG: glycosyltransferase family 1 protein [Bacteroidota bacterium]